MPKDVHQIETKAFGQIETEAKPVLDKLIRSGPESLTVRERYWWTMYLNASFLRVPHVIENVKAITDQALRQTLSSDPDEYNEVKGNAPEATLLEWAQNHSPGRLMNLGMRTLVDLLNNERTIDRIIHLAWFVRDVTSSSRPLLLGDDPFERINDLFRPGTLISIPLSPTHVFFGTDSAVAAQRIQRLTPKEIARLSNVSTLTTARKFAYGVAERKFVDKYLLRRKVL